LIVKEAILFMLITDSNPFLEPCNHYN